MAWSSLLILLIVAMACCSIGFHNYVWFMSIGYGLAVAGIGITDLIFQLSSGRITALTIVLSLLLVAYGFRLAGFLFYREMKNASYRKTLDQVAKNTTGGKKMPVVALIALWVSVALLYVAESCPVYYRYYNHTSDSLCGWISAGISLFGVIFEAVADQQKSTQKKTAPHSPAMHGLYRIVRCPNYLGEIVFWTGIFLSGCTVFNQPGQWILALTGYVLILYVMFSGARRLEKRQEKNYGKDPVYQKYSDTTPILIPFVPLYHLIKVNRDES